MKNKKHTPKEGKELTPQEKIIIMYKKNKQLLGLIKEFNLKLL
jgi:hypothetical protein